MCARLPKIKNKIECMYTKNRKAANPLHKNKANHKIKRKTVPPEKNKNANASLKKTKVEHLRPLFGKTQARAPLAPVNTKNIKQKKKSPKGFFASSLKPSTP